MLGSCLARRGTARGGGGGRAAFVCHERNLYNATRPSVAARSPVTQLTSFEQSRIHVKPDSDTRDQIRSYVILMAHTGITNEAHASIVLLVVSKDFRLAPLLHLGEPQLLAPREQA